MNSSRRLLPVYLAASAVATTGMIGATTISAIAAERMLSSAAWSGLPMAAAIFGTAAGSQLVGRLLERVALRKVLAGQYAVALFGGVIAVLGVVHGSFLLLALGLVTLGLGHGVTQYTRYLAADLFPASRRGRALSWVVWTGSIGAVLGPALLAPSSEISLRLGLPGIAGPYLAVTLAFCLCAVGYGLLLPTGRFASIEAPTAAASAPRSVGPMPEWPTPAKVAFLAMVVGHVVMVFVMTMTPLHLTHQGHGLSLVGIVISAHVAGMYLLAPAAGWLSDRFGAGRTLLAGSLLLSAACLLAAMASQGRVSVPMAIPLFLLGLGWNFGFVAGSALLNNSLPPSLRLRGRARADAGVWVAAAGSSLLSSLLFAQIGFARLSWVGCGAGALLAAALFLARNELREPCRD